MSSMHSIRVSPNPLSRMVYRSRVFCLREGVRVRVDTGVEEQVGESKAMSARYNQREVLDIPTK